MSIDQLVVYFSTNKGALKRGNKSTAKRTHSKLEDVILARKMFRQRMKIETFPKILVFDIETAPMKAYVWRMWKENISIDQLLDDYFIICWSAKWLYSTEVMGNCVTPKEALNEDDARVVKSLHALFDEADIIIAHNGLQFDVPRVTTRFLCNGLTPPSPYKIVDTLKVAKKQFGFSSNKLDFLAKKFDIPCKLDTDFELWKKCLEGDKDALAYMYEYNQHDVEILEEVYIKLLPWIKNHPNIGNYTEDFCCSNCGSEDLILVPDKYYYTSVNKYPVYKCEHCGAYTRGRKASPKEGSTPLTSIAT